LYEIQTATSTQYGAKSITLGRFLKALKEINNEVTDFASLYQPKYYDDCIKAVYQVARYNTETQRFGAA